MRPSSLDVAAAQERGWSAVNNTMTIDAATSPVLMPWTDEVAVERHCAAPVATGQGTGLSFAGIYAPVGVLGTDGMGADQVQVKVRIPAALNGIPPRGVPSRC
jgi:hypothetical protein